MRKKKAFQRIIASLALVMVVAVALRPTATSIWAAVLIGAAIAWAVFSELLAHHKRGDHKKAARGFWRAYAVLGGLLLLLGVATLILTDTLIPLLDVTLGTSMTVLGTRKYATLRA